MSRRRQDRRGHVGAPRRGPGADLDASRSLDGIASAVVPAAALLPIRFFFGITFLYAGFDKLLDPTFFDPASAASIQAQMTAFAGSSPIGALAGLSEPLAVPIGLAIAIAEIAIGLGALSGLAFRLAAAGGAMLSLLFWLTASWAVRPYYYGPDLPYAVGWLALALAGTGGLLVPRPLRPRPKTVDRRPSNVLAPSAPGLTRRVVLQAALLAGAAVVVASLAVPLRWLGVDLGSGTRASGRPSPSPSPGATTMPPTGTPCGHRRGRRPARDGVLHCSLRRPEHRSQPAIQASSCGWPTAHTSRTTPCAPMLAAPFDGMLPTTSSTAHATGRCSTPRTMGRSCAVPRASHWRHWRSSSTLRRARSSSRPEVTSGHSTSNQPGCRWRPDQPDECSAMPERSAQRQRDQRDRGLLATAEGDRADRLLDDFGRQGAEPVDELLGDQSMLRPVSPEAASIREVVLTVSVARNTISRCRSPISPTTTGPTWIATWNVGFTPKSRTYRAWFRSTPPSIEKTARTQAASRSPRSPSQITMISSAHVREVDLAAIRDDRVSDVEHDAIEQLMEAQCTEALGDGRRNRRDP